MKNKILVTGGLGYIGSHTCVELLKEDVEIIIVDNLSNSKIEVLDNLYAITGKKPDFYQLDVTDKKEFEKIFAENKIDSVIHFAAYKAVGESQSLALAYYHNNINSLTVLLSLMQQYNVKNIVFSSSCTVYGIADKIPVDESESIKEAESVYGTTKIMGEKIIEDVTKSDFNLNAVILRYFNPVGSHESGLIGENPKGIPNNLFPIILETINGKRECLSIFGKDYNTKDGTAVRDYIHVVDLGDAHVKALKFMSKSTSNLSVFNVGTGIGLTVLEVIDQFQKELGVPINFNYADRRKGDLEKIWANNDKAVSVLGWKPKYKMEDMVKSCLKWNNNYGE